MICSFSNVEVRNFLPLNHHIVYATLRRFWGLSTKRKGFSDYAQWDTGIIATMAQRNDIELFVFASHGGMKKRKVSFNNNGITYTFFRHEFATMLKHVIKIPSIWRALNPLSREIARCVKAIEPDLVLLCGAENPHYASSVLQIDGYPIYLLCQTIYNSPTMKANGSHNPINGDTELRIFEKVDYAGVYCAKHYNELRDLGYKGKIFEFQWPIKGEIPKVDMGVEKLYDFVIFANGLSEGKGFHDSIKALAIVRKSYPQIKMNIIDSGPVEMRSELERLIDGLELNDNIIFTPFFDRIVDLYQHLMYSRFAVLPSKVDNVSGTMLQCMNYGMPIVVYRTDGTALFNQNKQCVQIAKMADVDDLAAKMIELLDNHTLAENVGHNAFEYRMKAIEKDKKNIIKLVRQMEAIVDNYQHHIPIPNELLFEINQA